MKRLILPPALALLAAGAAALPAQEGVEVHASELGAMPVLTVPRLDAAYAPEGFLAVPIGDAQILIPRPDLLQERALKACAAGTSRESSYEKLRLALAGAVLASGERLPRLMYAARHAVVLPRFARLGATLRLVAYAPDENGEHPVQELPISREILEDLAAVAERRERDFANIPRLYDGAGQWIEVERDARAAESAPWLEKPPRLEDWKSVDAQLQPLLRRAYRRNGLEIPSPNDGIARARGAENAFLLAAPYIRAFARAFHSELGAESLEPDWRLMVAEHAARLYLRMKDTASGIALSLSLQDALDSRPAAKAALHKTIRALLGVARTRVSPSREPEKEPAGPPAREP